jgi:hypothetical protein
MAKNRVLFLGEKEKEAIARLIDFAEKNRLSLEYMKSLMAGDRIPPGDNPDYACHITDGYRIVYTIEQHPLFFCRHISISVDDPEKLPSPPAVELIMKEFGFRGGINECLNVWIEEIPGVKAINALQKYE